MIYICKNCETKTIYSYNYRMFCCLGCKKNKSGFNVPDKVFDKWNSIFSKFKCLHCGNNFYHYRNSLFCSKECVNEYNKTKYIKKSPFYLLKEKSNFSCSACGINFDKPNKRLHIHHIQPKIYNGDDSNDNLIVLCSTCHMLAHRHLSAS